MRHAPTHDDEPAREGAPEWMVSYADMITIMMAFFVVMFAMSSLKDDQREEAVFNALQTQFGRFPHSATLTPPRAIARSRGGVDAEGRHQESKSLGPAAARPSNRVTRLRPGEDVVLGANLAFPEGESDLDDADRQKLASLVEEISGKSQRLEVRGHTSGRPLPANAPYRDQWDLAYARARRVMEQLVALGISPRRIRLSVAAGNEPVAGADPTRALENSRVQVSVLNETVGDYERQ